MKALLLILPVCCLASCASLQNASVADYNGDGAVSNAEYVQYQKQADIQDRNVYTESNKRRNAVNTLGDAADGLGEVHRIRDTFRAF
ncbi:MAG: hypothetical protein HC845_09640 [Akkermansiaceae bacterium]|nr:hypothetical protein [Akkermansiaceae bacterium]